MIKELNFVIAERKKLFRSKTLTLTDRIAKKTLEDYVTYRLPESANNDFFIVGRVYFRLLRSLFSSSRGKIEINTSSNSVILGPGLSKKQAILENLDFQGVEVPRFYFVKENLKPKLSLLEKIWVLFRITLYAKWMFVKTLNGKKRQRKALSILQVFETASILTLIDQKNISKVFDFTGFHIDSNFISMLLMARGIEVVKSPSPGPLKTHYQHLICSVICYSNPYQKLELEYYKDTMIYQEKTLWKPQMSNSYLPFYLENKFDSPPDNTLAFYSHGEWLRREMDHSDVGTGTLESEEFILECLKTFLRSHPDYILTVYPHPLEKKTAYFSQTKSYYNEKLNGLNYKIADAEMKTSLSFQQDNIAIVAASSMIYERLYCGFKVLIGGKKSSFIENSMLTNIEFQNFDEFEQQVSKSSVQGIDEYFNQNNLSDFKHAKN